MIEWTTLRADGAHHKQTFQQPYMNLHFWISLEISTHFFFFSSFSLFALLPCLYQLFFNPRQLLMQPDSSLKLKWCENRIAVANELCLLLPSGTKQGLWTHLSNVEALFWDTLRSLWRPWACSHWKLISVCTYTCAHRTRKHNMHAELCHVEVLLWAQEGRLKCSCKFDCGGENRAHPSVKGDQIKNARFAFFIYEVKETSHLK